MLRRFEATSAARSRFFCAADAHFALAYASVFVMCCESAVWTWSVDMYMYVCMYTRVYPI
jgi:hypothetical protein